MVEPVLVLGSVVAVGLAPTVAVAAVRARSRQRWYQELETFRLGLPGDLDLSALVAFLDGLSGILPNRWRRPFRVQGIVFEVQADEHRISHRLLVPQSQTGVVLLHLRAALPNVGIEPDPTFKAVDVSLAGELVTARPHMPLATDHLEVTSAAILAALQPLSAGEILVVQLIVSPMGHSQPPGSATPLDWVVKVTKGAPPSPEPPKAVREKYARPMFGATIRLGVASANRNRDRQLLKRLTGSFHQANSQHATLRRVWVPNRQARRALQGRWLPLFSQRSRLNSAELCGLLAWPPSKISLPGLQLANSRRLAPSSLIEREGRVLADANYPGQVRPLAISVRSSMMHVHLQGPTGSGKSTLLLHLFAQDVAAGRTVILLDPKKDLAEAALDVTPDDRDVVVIDATDDQPVGLNVFAGGTKDPELVSEQVLAILRRIWAAFWGPRTDDILRHALFTLVQIPGSSFAELSWLLTDPTYRQRIVGQIDDPLSLQPFWAWFNQLSDGERSQACGPVLNKLRAVSSRPRLRRVLGQGDSLVDFDAVLAERKVVIVQLAAGLLGEEAAALLGSFVLSKLWQAIQRRVRFAEADRTPAFCYLDEFQMMSLASPLPDVLALSRSANVSFHLANQHLAQLARETQAAVLANCRSHVVFQLSAADARTLAPTFAPHLAAQDLQGLGPYEVALSLAAGGSVAPPVTGRTRPAPAPLGHAALLRERSRHLYGRPAAEIDAQLRDRRAQLSAMTQIGRQRRAQ